MSWFGREVIVEIGRTETVKFDSYRLRWVHDGCDSYAPESCSTFCEVCGRFVNPKPMRVRVDRTEIEILYSDGSKRTTGRYSVGDPEPIPEC